MTDKRSTDERQTLAAEQALRLLTGAECAWWLILRVVPRTGFEPARACAR